MNKQTRNPAQISMTEEGILDSFAGGGGASTGIEIASGRVVAAAMVRANLPEWCGGRIETMDQLRRTVAV